MENHGIWNWNFPSLESHGIGHWSWKVMESHGKSWNLKIYRIHIIDPTIHSWLAIKWQPLPFDSNCSKRYWFKSILFFVHNFSYLAICKKTNETCWHMDKHTCRHAHIHKAIEMDGRYRTKSVSRISWKLINEIFILASKETRNRLKIDFNTHTYLCSCG